MERGPLKIYPHGISGEFSSTRPWHWSVWVKHSLDPLTVVAVYAGLLWLHGHRVTGSDVLVMTFALFLLSPPTGIPFRIFNARVARALALLWVRVVAFVGGLWAVSERADLALEIDARITAAWLLLTPFAMLLLHLSTPQILPRFGLLYPRRKVVVVGVNKAAMKVSELIAQRAHEGQQFDGFFDDRAPSRLGSLGARPLIGRLSEVSGYVQSNAVDTIYISLPMASQPRVMALLESLADTTASIHFLPDIFVADPIQARVATLAGMPVVSVCESPFDGPDAAIKRAFDLALVLASLPLLIPLVIGIAAVVRATSPGPAFFTQRRYGLDGKEILVFKFRTMSTLEDGQHTYKQVTRGDPRVTPVGSFLRKTSLDELPQLFNVLLGSMSLVGPRPHALAVNEQYRRLIPRYMVRHKVKPGITGWAQVNGCRGGDDLESMRRRTEFDLAYLRSWSLVLDVKIVLKTVKILAAGDDQAY